VDAVVVVTRRPPATSYPPLANTVAMVIAKSNKVTSVTSSGVADSLLFPAWPPPPPPPLVLSRILIMVALSRDGSGGVRGKEVGRLIGGRPG